MNSNRLSFWQLWNISLGFFGVQIAYSLQSANISRIFATLGADPHDLRTDHDRASLLTGTLSKYSDIKTESAIIYMFSLSFFLLPQVTLENLL